MKARTVEIATIAIALGVSNSTVERKAARDRWPSVLGESSGGRPPRLYLFRSLPRHIQDALEAAETARIRADLAAVLPPPVVRAAAEPDPRPLAKGDGATRRRDAKLAIFVAFEALRQASGYSLARAYTAFAALYCAAALEVHAGRAPSGPEAVSSLPRTVFETIPALSARTLERIVSTARSGDIQALKGRHHSRKDTGVLATAIDPRGKIKGPGAVLKLMLALITAQPHLSARSLRDQVIGNVGPELLLSTGELVPMPPLRTFQWYLKRLRTENESIILAVTNPDGWRSKYEYAFGEQPTGEFPNDIWQIDASPADALLVTGRHSVYVLTDLYTRRIMILVTRTPRAAAVIALVRRALLAWGVPRTIKTDNGSDFVAKVVAGVFAALKIDNPRAQAFTPTEKGHVERAIGTLQHDFMPLQPGFIGHSVADRTAIEARRSFAQRLGDKDEKAAFCVELDQVELQRRLDVWCEVNYPHRPHEGLDRRTPAEVTASWTGAIRRITDERALDLLLWDIPSGDGFRTVTKKGITVERATFWGPGLEPGKRVRVRLDPTDMGRIYVYTAEDDAFVCVAEAPERLGISRAAVAAKAKADQRQRQIEAKRELARARRSLRPLHEVAEEIARARVPASPANVTSFPRAAVDHTTPALSAAADAAGRERPAAPVAANPVVTPAPVIRLPERAESPAERERRAKQEAMARWKRLDAEIAAGREVSDADRRFHRDYQTLTEFKAAMVVAERMAAYRDASA